MKEFPKPSNGSLICTFGDCPDREEHMKGEDNYGLEEDCLEVLCPDGSHLSARVMDYSICLNKNLKPGEHACRIGRGGAEVSTKWCEAALCAGVCPRGFRR
jgi:hypothetical protein